MKKLISRRDILKRTFCGAAGLAAISVIGPSLLSSCQKKSEAAQSSNNSSGSSSCPNQESLTKDQKAIREGFKYVDQSPIKTQTCDNCKLFTNPISGSLCGGCTIVPGPIHPKGHCTSWIAKV